MNILITTALNPILDAVAACYAYWKLRLFFHEQATIGIAGKEDLETQWLLKELKIADVIRLENTNEGFDVFIVWNAVRDGVSFALPQTILPHRVIEIIDRGRKDQNDYSPFPKAIVRIEPVTFSTMATEQYQARRLAIDPISTQFLYCAIYIATNNLDPERTTPRDRAALRYLQTQFNVPLTLVRDLFIATQPR